jgi:hypothetical protein
MKHAFSIIDKWVIEKCIWGERWVIFSYPLSSYVKCLSYMHVLLELILETHSTIWDAFLLLSLLVGVSLRVRSQPPLSLFHLTHSFSPCTARPQLCCHQARHDLLRSPCPACGTSSLPSRRRAYWWCAQEAIITIRITPRGIFDPSRIKILMGLWLESPLACPINMRGGATCHNVKTLVVTSSWPNPETWTVHEVLAHPRTAFQPCTCGLCGGATVVATELIGYSIARLLLGWWCGGGDRLLPLHQHTTTLDQCSDSSSVAPRV